MEDAMQYLAFFTIRFFLGALFFFQGFDKLFKVGIKEVVRSFEVQLTQAHKYRAALFVVALITSWIEFIAGALLILGFFTAPALYMLSFDLLLVGAAFSLVKPMWDMQFVFPRLVLLIALELLPLHWNVYSIDYFLKLIKS